MNILQILMKYVKFNYNRRKYMRDMMKNCHSNKKHLVAKMVINIANNDIWEREYGFQFLYGFYDTAAE